MTTNVSIMIENISSTRHFEIICEKTRLFKLIQVLTISNHVFRKDLSDINNPDWVSNQKLGHDVRVAVKRTCTSAKFESQILAKEQRELM